MKYFIAICLLCTTFISKAATFEHAQEIYVKIIKANGYWSSPKLRYSPSTEINANAGWGSITINEGMLRFVRNDAELALVLGHEIGHYKLGHWSSTPRNEYSADAYGARVIGKAGYSVCTGARVLKRFNAPDSDTHPASIKRYRAICH